MKKTINSILSLFILFSVAVADASETRGFKKFQLLPKDDSQKNKEFSLFMNDFRKAVKTKNIASLKNNIAPDIVYSFGEEDGLKGFLKIWNLDKKNKTSKFWDEMEKVLSMGSAIYDEENNSYAYPYLFVTFPADYDIYEFAAVTGKKVNVRMEPSSKSPVVETLDYEIVKAISSDEEPKVVKVDGMNGKWIKVLTSSGKEGFIFSQFIHSPIGYRAIFQKIGKRWLLTAFISGD